MVFRLSLFTNWMELWSSARDYSVYSATRPKRCRSPIVLSVRPPYPEGGRAESREHIDTSEGAESQDMYEERSHHLLTVIQGSLNVLWGLLPP